MNSSPKSNEVISVFIGTPAVNLSLNIFELLSLEHGINPDGSVQSITEDSFSKLKDPSSFFTQTKSGKNVPKALLFTSDSPPINELKQSVYRNLFDAENLISGKSVSGIYSIAYSTGKLYIDTLLDRIRKLADNCENLDAIMLYFPLSGGTGSGVSALLLESLRDFYERVDRIGVNFYPCRTIANTHHFMDYNTGFSMVNSLENLDASIAIDNESVWGICERNFQGNLGYYSSVNRVIAQCLSGITAGNRLDGAARIGVGEIRDYLVPEPKLKFLMPGLAPLTSAERIFQKENSVYEITNSVFSKGNSLIGGDVMRESVISGNLYYRGEVMPGEVAKTLEEFESACKFTPGSTRSFNVSLNYFPNTYVPGGDMGRYLKSCCSLMNGMEFNKVLGVMKQKYAETQKNEWFKRWVEKYDEGFELMGGDLTAPITRLEEYIEAYNQSATEIIGEL